jgi:hypothetical protein
LLHPPDYTKDYILYLAASTSTISMVLVQEDSSGEEHVIYYLRKSLSGPELHYSHVEKLALAAVIVVQRFRHYILSMHHHGYRGLKPHVSHSDTSGAWGKIL